MKQRCKQAVWHEFNWGMCMRGSVKDGYCNQHHPDTVKKREQEKEERYRVKQEASPYKKIAKLEHKNDCMRKALEQIARRCDCTAMPHLDNIDKGVHRDSCIRTIAKNALESLQ